MSRIVVAVLVLFAVLAGLRFSNSSLFQRNASNQINNSASETRSTGFNADSTGTSSGTSAVSQSTQTQTQPGTATGTTPLPPSQRPAIPAGW